MPVITMNSNELLLPARVGGKDLPRLEISCGRLFKVSDKRRGANSKVLFRGIYSTEKGFQDTPIWFLDHRIFTDVNMGWARFLEMFLETGIQSGAWQYMPSFEDIVLPDIEREDYSYYPLWVLETLKRKGLFEKALRTTPIGGTPDDDKMILDKDELDQYYYLINKRAKQEMDFLKQMGINEPVSDTAILHKLRLKAQEEARKTQIDLVEREKIDNYLDQALAARKGSGELIYREGAPELQEVGEGLNVDNSEVDEIGGDQGVDNIDGDTVLDDPSTLDGLGETPIDDDGEPEDEDLESQYA